ncbi:MAG: ankyrin repeat domain-containing protein [Legionella sp.]|jgi:hypothetical protein
MNYSYLTPRERLLAAFRFGDNQEIAQLLNNGLSPNLYILPKRKLTLVGAAQFLKNDYLIILFLNYGGVLQDISSQAPLSPEELVQIKSISAAEVPVESQPVESQPVETKRNQFLKAVNSANLEVFRKLIGEGFNPNILVNELNDTALHIACRTNNTDMLTILLTALKLAFNLKNKQGSTPISLAIESRSTNVLNQLKNLPNFKLLITEYFNNFYIQTTNQITQFLFDNCRFTAEELQNIFLKQARGNNASTISFLLSNYANILGTRVVSELGDYALNGIWGTFENILFYLVTSNNLDPIDNLLPLLIENRRLRALTTVLNTSTPMRSLMTIDASKLLIELAKDNSLTGKAVLDTLINAAKKRHPAIAFRVNRLLNPSQNNMQAELPKKLEELLQDPINIELFENPHGTSEGHCFSYTSILRCQQVQEFRADGNPTHVISPISRNTVIIAQLRPNLLLEDLIAFLNAPEPNEQTPPMLLSLFTSQPLIKPQLASNGIIYDEAELPEQLKNTCYPDLTMMALCEYYKNIRPVAVPSQLGIFSTGPTNSPSNGNDAGPSNRMK